MYDAYIFANPHTASCGTGQIRLAACAVPFANGMELYRGLKDAGVQTELVVIENTGHVISRPKERRAAMQQNIRWFDTHLFGDRDTPDLDLVDR